MSAPTFDIATPDRVPTWSWYMRFWRVFAGIVNCLTPCIFSPTTAFPLTKRINRYAPHTVSQSFESAGSDGPSGVGTAWSALMGLNPRVISYTPGGAGKVSHLRLSCVNPAAFVLAEAITLELYRIVAGVPTLVGVALTIDAATQEDELDEATLDATTINTFSGTQRFEVRMAAHPIAQRNVKWSVTMELKSELAAAP